MKELSESERKSHGSIDVVGAFDVGRLMFLLSPTSVVAH